MRDRPRARVRMVYDDEGPTEATARAMERLAELPDGTVVDMLQVMTNKGSGGRGGETRVEPKPSEPSETPGVFLVWGRRPCMAYSVGPGTFVPVSPSDMAYPSEDGGMSFVMPSNDALSVVVRTDEDKPSPKGPQPVSSWTEDEAIKSLPDGSVVEVLWQEDGETVGMDVFLMYDRSLAMLPEAGGGEVNI